MSAKTYLVYVLRCVGLVLLIPGCHIIAAYESYDTTYECKTHIVNCGKKPAEPQPIVTRPQPSGTCYTVTPDRSAPGATQTPWEGLRVGDRAYCDRPWKIDRIEMPGLRDAARILTAHADNEVDRPDFLEFPWASDTDTLFIAYDSRATKVPDWLNPADYRKVLGPTGQPLHIRVSGGDQLGHVDLAIYERLGSPPSGPIRLGSNQAGSPTWAPGTTAHISLMYMVILQPKLDLDCSNLTGADVVETVISTGCGYKIKDQVKVDCEFLRGSRTLTEQACRNIFSTDGEPTCISLGKCPSEEAITEVYGKRAFAWTFTRNSEIEFDPAVSRARITVAGNRRDLNAAGYVHFEYLLDDFDRLHTFDLNSLNLDLGSTSTAIGSFSDIKVVLTSPSVARCRDPNPPWATPCDTYDIPARDVLATLSFRHDGRDIITVAQNAAAWPIAIDHQTRSFRIGPASLRATLKVNGDDREVLTEIDLTGRFKNFEPHASAEESTRVVECGVGDTLEPSNIQPVHLSSAGSFDVYESVSGATFDWYEDFGLSSQRTWGQGASVTIPPWQLSYGTHQMTLVLRDSSGAMSTDDVEVAVHDRMPPTITAPPDRYFLMTRPGGPVRIDLGTATASDTCEPSPRVSNDAPTGSMFPPGLTRVTWTADDGGGNTATAVQNVWVFQTPDVGEPVLIYQGYAELLEAVAATTSKSMAALETCSTCTADFEALSAHLATLESSLAEAGLASAPTEVRARILGGLGTVRARLGDADRALSRADATAGQVAELRAEALAIAAGTDAVLLELGELLRALADAERD